MNSAIKQQCKHEIDLLSGFGRRFDDADVTPPGGETGQRKVRGARVRHRVPRSAAAAVRTALLVAVATGGRGHFHAAGRAQRPGALRARRFGDEQRHGPARTGTGAQRRVSAAVLPAEAAALRPLRGRQRCERPAAVDAGAGQSAAAAEEHAQDAHPAAAERRRSRQFARRSPLLRPQCQRQCQCSLRYGRYPTKRLLSINLQFSFE